jgi:aminoglycoside phosphotransferase (APT) family kinase protein
MSPDTTQIPVERDAGAPGIDVARVSDWLAKALPELTPPFRFSRVGQGQSNLTFRVDDAAAHSVVLRRPPLGELLASAHDVGREYRILSALAPVGARVPRPLATCSESDVTGAPFYVMEFVDGLILTAARTAERLPATAREAAGRSIVDTLVELHDVDVDAAGLAEFRRPESLVSRQLRRWARQWEASKTRELPVVDEVSDQLARRMPEEHETVLLHGDYHVHNFVIDEDGSVKAVLDWELCTVGDPLADVGQMVAYWDELGAFAGRPDALFREPITQLPGFPRATELAEMYAESSGRDLGQLGFWVAFAYWKIAIIVEGVYRRWLNDPTNGSDAGSLQPAVERLAGLARDALGHASRG